MAKKAPKQPASPRTRAKVAADGIDEPTQSTETRRTRKGEATRRAIMDTALALFAREGYHRTTVPMIVREAGIGHGTFYDYFTSRRDILLELTKEAGRALAPKRAERSTATLAERIRAEVLWYLTDHVEDLKLYKIWAEAEQFDEQVARDRRVLRDLRTARIRRAIELSAPDGVNPEVAAVALNAMLEGFVYRWYAEGDQASGPRDVVEAAETLATMWVNAIGADSVGGRRAR